MNNLITISERTTARDIERGTKFLRTLSFSLPIFNALSTRAGYNQGEHGHGWDLLLVLMGQKSVVERDSPAPSGPVQAAKMAVSALDTYDGAAFARTRAALENRYPEQHTYLLGGLSQGSGASSVGTVQTFLDRYRALKDGSDPERASTREDDQAAVALLEQRRIVDVKSEAQLRGYIAQAKAAPGPADLTEGDAQLTPEYQQAARAFHVWLKDWRSQARTVIERRDYQIRLGLASRRQADDDESDDVAEAEAEAAGVAS